VYSLFGVSYRQLKLAQERLHKLQNLVNQVQSIPGLVASLPDDVNAELNRQASLDNNATRTAASASASASSALKTSHDIR